MPALTQGSRVDVVFDEASLDTATSQQEALTQVSVPALPTTGVVLSAALSVTLANEGLAR